MLVPETPHRFGELWILFMGASVSVRLVLLRAYPPLSVRARGRGREREVWRGAGPWLDGATGASAQSGREMREGRSEELVVLSPCNQKP